MTRRHVVLVAAPLAALTAISVIAWLIVLLVPGAPAELRAQLAFAFVPEHAEAEDALAFAVNNFKVCLLALLGCAAQQLYVHSPRPRGTARLLFDVVIGVVYTANAAQFGIALGAYGTRLLEWIPHVPLELAALAASASAYRHSRHGNVPRKEVVALATHAAAFITVAAAIETWMVPLL